MSSRQAVYGVGAALLVTYLAAANMPADPPPARARGPRAAATSGTESLAAEVRAQAARLHARMAQAPVPEPNPRNPFAFGVATRPARPALNHDAARLAVEIAPAMPMLPPLPALTLMGIAEETTPGGPRRTAVIAGDGETLYMVAEGQPVGDRYKVTKIGADAVELEDILTHGYRRIAMR